jgi:hypothetical protein
LKPIRAITILLPLSAALLCPLVSRRPQQSRPISLHPVNPHYFLWRDRPTTLITSGEHYGAKRKLCGLIRCVPQQYSHAFRRDAGANRTT